MNIETPEKLIDLYTTDKRFVAIRGGRGSGKSWAVADFLLAKGVERTKRVLCCREIQNSIKDSVHRLLSDRIKYHGLEAFYEVTDKTIRGINGTDFIFKGLFRNENDIKSTEGIDYCWIEEAHSVSRKSLEVLTPTIRKANSQIIFTYNPTNNDDPVHADYTLAERDDTLKIECLYYDNPWFPDVLNEEMEYDRATNPDKYAHKWLGQCVVHSDAQVFFGKWKIQEFDSDFPHYYLGADWGFAKDPTTLIRCAIRDKMLWIDHEAYAIGCEITQTPNLFKEIPDSYKYEIIADNARPETISHMRNAGFKIKGAAKGKGSVEDGIEHIKGFESVIIHPRCRHAIDEFRLYQYKTDPLTGKITNKLSDKDNHIIDALRYALEDVMRYASGAYRPVRTMWG